VGAAGRLRVARAIRSDVSRHQPSLRTALLASLPTWVGSRVAVAILSVAAAGTAAERADGAPSFREIWDRWDVQLFWKVARFGYFGDQRGDYPDVGLEAVFPGMPLLLRLVHVVVRDWVLAGLVISFVAGVVACTCLWWLASDELGPQGGHRAVLYLVLAPFAVFLFAGYSEMAWLAFATSAWVAGRRGRWAYAGLLGIGTGLIRVTGVFLALGLVVEYLTAGRARRDGRLVGWDAAWLLLPFAATASYIVWLHAKTGDWKAYQNAQLRGWGRTLVAPWEAFRTTYRAAVYPAQPGSHAWQSREELLCVVIGALLFLILLALRRWGEATYVGSSVALFSASSYYASTARGLLLWWPLYILVAGLSLRREWVHYAVVCTCAPLMAAIVVVFTSGRWAG